MPTDQLLTELAEYHLGAESYPPPGVDHLDSGRDRVVYVDYDYDLVYKLCHQPGDSANREEVRVLAELRAQGAAHAPEAHLRVVQARTGDGATIDVDIVVMPYLPDEGTPITERPLLPGAGDFNPTNSHFCRGQWWLIDAAGL